jgi:hypothetical protein
MRKVSTVSGKRTHWSRGHGSRNCKHTGALDTVHISISTLEHGTRVTYFDVHTVAQDTVHTYMDVHTGAEETDHIF